MSSLNSHREHLCEQLSRRFPNNHAENIDDTYMSLMSGQVVNTLINFFVETNDILEVL